MNPSSDLYSPTPARWVKGSSRSLAATRIFDVRGVDYRHPVRGTQREFVVIDAPDWVNVLALTPCGRLVLVNQFRYGTDEFSWEIPGGVIERGEDPVEAGLRELQEETGYVGKAAKLLGSVNPNPAIMNNRCHLVLVEDVVLTTAQTWDPDEEMEVLSLPVEDVYAWAQSGRITHSLVLNALLLFYPVWEQVKDRLVKKV